MKDIRDKAEALRAYARQAGDIAMLNMASEIKVCAERRAGELLRDAADRGERDKRGGDRKTESTSHAATLTDLGITRSQSSRWQQVAVIPEPKFETYPATNGNRTATVEPWNEKGHLCGGLTL